MMVLYFASDQVFALALVFIVSAFSGGVFISTAGGRQYIFLCMTCPLPFFTLSCVECMQYDIRMAGGHVAAVEALKVHQRNSSVAEQACLVLCFLTQYLDAAAVVLLLKIKIRGKPGVKSCIGV